MDEKPIIEIPKVKCEKCGESWIPRVKTIVQCPFCKNRKWYVKGNKKKEEADNV